MGNAPETQLTSTKCTQYWAFVAKSNHHMTLNYLLVVLFSSEHTLLAMHHCSFQQRRWIAPLVLWLLTQCSRTQSHIDSYF